MAPCSRIAGKSRRISGEQMRRDVVTGEVTILISSPNRLTSYHVDQDCNFLIQVAGNKTLMVYDHTDPTLVSHEEREQFHMGNIRYALSMTKGGNARLQLTSCTGRGVHIPVFAPHWARNHDNISIALSVNYLLRPMLIQQLQGEQRAAQIGRLPNSARRI